VRARAVVLIRAIVQGAPPRPIREEPRVGGALVPPNWLRAAPVTRVIILLNIAVFVAQIALAGSSSAFAHIPIREQLAFGANYAIATLHEHRVETLVTACFLHAGIVHIGFNMLALWQAGPLVERAVGSARMAPLYLVSGIISSLVSALVMSVLGEDGLSVGASGAISGVIAAAMVVGWRVQGWRGPLTQAMARWLGFVLVFGLLSKLGGGNIDNAAHIGGAACGAIIAALWQRGYAYSARVTRGILAACALVVVLAALMVVARDRRDPYVMLLASERLTVARNALAVGQCRVAHGALMATERLYPRDPEVVEVRGAFDAVCGRPM
jgi:rhomboid protease GluP